MCIAPHKLNTTKESTQRKEINCLAKTYKVRIHCILCPDCASCVNYAIGRDKYRLQG